MDDQMAGQEAVRSQIHGMWASVAPNWALHADYLDERGSAITATMLDRVALEPGDRALELACGPGGVGLVAAQRVGDKGEVVMSDVAIEMTTIAEKRASELGLTNVRTAVLDLEQIDQPDESYDVVLCREGLMFAVEPERAAREIRRVLRPDGRIAIRGVGASRAKPLARGAVRRRHGRDRLPRSSSWDPGTVLARRCSAAPRPADRGGTRQRRGRGLPRAGPRAIVRRALGPHGRARRPARGNPVRPVGRRTTRHRPALSRGARAVRDARRSRDPRRHLDRVSAPQRLRIPERLADS